ncbi:MAG: hypothetical protein AABY93_12425 [Bacteroidota bacterium]
MKTTIILLALALSACTVQSNLIPDKDGYALQIDGYNQEITVGQSKQIEVNVLRSGAYMNKPIKLKVISPLPEGLSISFTSQPVMFSKAVAELNSSASTKHGVYTIVLAGDAITASLPSKGIIFKLSVN